MNERIKKLRKILDLTQVAFGERIGLKQNSVALVESGKRNFSDYQIRVVCREFGVNEEWLRTGVGEMFEPQPSSELDTLAEKYRLTHRDYVFIETLLKNPERRAALEDFCLEFAQALQATDVPVDPPASGTAAAEAAYAEALGFVPSTDSSVLNSTGGTLSIAGENKKEA